jgi:hypothetical protein
VDVKVASADLFLQKQGDLVSLTLFQDYARYLLETTGIDQLPIPLDKIRNKHNFNRYAAPLPKGRGFLVGDSIFINSDDKNSVQRFTEAHEIMETLVVALRSEAPTRINPEAKMKFERDKENWCEQGAAELLMPGDLFFPKIKGGGISLVEGKQMAKLCQTSLTATIRRMLDSDVSPCIFAILHEGHKKKQIVPSKTGQGVLWGSPSEWDPSAELRVWKRWNSPQVKVFLCKNESFSRDSIAYQTLLSSDVGQINKSQDNLDLEYIKGEYLVETLLVKIEDIPSVMILIHV